MANVNAALHAFNRGVVSPRALGRVDIEKLRLAAEEQTNWLPTVLGPMTIRPGLQYIGGTKSNLAMQPIPFVFSMNDMAILELTPLVMRVRVDDTLVSFPSVSTSVVNGDFSSSTGWTLTSGGSSTAAISSNQLTLSGASSAGIASAERSVTVASGDQNVRHGLKIVVARGPVNFRAGSSSGLDDYITKTTLDTGTHYLALTPTGSSFYVYFEGVDLPSRIVTSIATFTGTLEVPTPWTAPDLAYVRYVQSGDVVFVACRTFQPRRIERRDTDSWSIVLYKTNDGPFNLTDESVTLTPSALSGDITLTASRSYFKSTNVGSLFRLFHQGQDVNATIAADDTFTDTIRVTGIGSGRTFQYTVSGTFSGTWTLQRSFESETTGFVDVLTGTGTALTTLTDDFDNSIIFYRIGFKSSDYASGSATFDLQFAGGGGAGVCRITGFTNSTTCDAEVLTPFKNSTVSSDWLEGAWSDRRGWPSAVTLHEGRLWWASGDNIWGSKSDDYTSFDYDATGDSAPVDRTIGYGPVDVINWMLPLNRLIIGSEGSEITARSTSLDEALTATNFNLKDASTLGSARLPALKMGNRGIFVQRGLRRIYSLSFTTQVADYSSNELTRLAPEICSADVVAVGIQMQPDTRLHFILDDGTAAVLVYDLDDDVVAWWKVETDGTIENIVVLPGAPEDQVYYVVARTINNSTVRYLERFARFDQCSGLPDCRLADAHYIYSGSATTTITGLSYLNGETVVVWGYTSGATTGQDLGTYTVSGGQITGLSASVVWACVGLAYDATYKSAKLAYGAQKGTALTQRKRIDRIGLIMHNTHYQGVTYGQDTDHLDPLPLIEDGTETSSNTVWTDYDKKMFPLNGKWDTDSRLYLKASAPRPATVMAAVVQVATHED